MGPRKGNSHSHHVSTALRKSVDRMWRQLPAWSRDYWQAIGRYLRRPVGWFWQTCNKHLRVYLALLGAAAAIFLVIYPPIWQSSHLPESDRFQAENDARRTVVQILGGLGLLATLWLGWRRVAAVERRVDIEKEGQITERFTRATDQLGSEKVEIRLGGIFALERIAKESKADHWPIIQILCAFVRDQARWKEPAPSEPESEGEPPRLREDIQAILTVLGRRNLEHESDSTPELDLRDTDLRCANLYAAHLERAVLYRVRLDNAYLPKAHLQRARLDRACLKGATLIKADLKGAILVEVDLEGASLSRANLEHAYLHSARLKNAALHEARLKNASLFKVRLEKARLDWACLEGADLTDAHLESARLDGVNLAQACLMDAHLENAGLMDADLSNIQNWEHIASIKHANIHGVKNPPHGFVEWARERGATQCDSLEWATQHYAYQHDEPSGPSSPTSSNQ